MYEVKGLFSRRNGIKPGCVTNYSEGVADYLYYYFDQQSDWSQISNKKTVWCATSRYSVCIVTQEPGSKCHENSNYKMGCNIKYLSDGWHNKTIFNAYMFMTGRELPKH